MRPTWDDYFITIALDVSTRSTCLRAQVGAIIVKDKRILTTGYNGAPKGLPHCLPYGERVRLGDGTSEQIGKIYSRWKQGEIIHVSGYDCERMKIVSKPLVRAFRQPAHKRFWLKLRTKGHARKHRVCVSTEHKILRVDDNKWVEAGQLQIGQRLLHDTSSPTPFQTQIMLGCSLGDGSVGRLKNWGAWLTYLHSLKQSAYALWKAEQLVPFSSPPRARTSHAFGRAWKQISIYCQVHPSIAEILLLAPVQRLEHLDYVGLACWYQDDGTTKHADTPHLCTYGWSSKQAQEAARILTRRFGIHFVTSRHSKYFGLGVCAHSKAEFFEKIAPFVHPSMQYKVPPVYRTNCVPRDPDTPTAVSEFEIVSREQYEADIVGYDLEIQDTHNFFTANGVLVSNCTDEGCEIVNGHCVRTLHAEQNAILQAALYGVSLEGGTIYTTHQPCHTCAKMIINAGLARVVYAGKYPDELAMKYLRLAGVQIDHMDLGERTPAPPPSILNQ